MNSRLLSRCAIALLLFAISASAQTIKMGNVWVQGEWVVCSTTFNGSAAPVNQQLLMAPIFFAIGHSNICDSAGNLLLACDGYNLYDKDLNRIEGGDTIIPKLLYERYDGFTLSAQSSIILPFDNGKHIVVTPTASDSEVINYWNQPSKGRSLFDLLLYTEVDMNANGGTGKVVKKMVPLLENVTLSKTQMMACRHSDGKSWWLLKQALDTNMVYKFLFTEDTVYGPYVQGFAEPHFSKWGICGQAMFSADGTKYATTIQNARKAFLADFDRCSGMLSGPKVVEVPMRRSENPTDPTQGDSSTCGLAFSPNGRFLYVNGFYTVQQLDLHDNNIATAWTPLSGPDTTWQEFQSYSNIYPGPDGKLYVGNWDGLGGQMSVIDNPDAKGTAAAFCRKCLRFPGYISQGITRFAGVSSPPCMPNYDLGPTNPICYTVGVKAPVADRIDLTVFPNPASTSFSIQCAQSGTFQMTDVTGRTVVRSTEVRGKGEPTNIDVGNMPSGVYYYRYSSKGHPAYAGKIIISNR